MSRNKGIEQALEILEGLSSEAELEAKMEQIVVDYIKGKTPDCLKDSTAVVDLNNFDGDLVTFKDEFLNGENYHQQNTEDFYKRGKLTAVFHNLAKVLDELAENGIYIYNLNPEDIYLAGNKIFFNWNKLKNIAASGEKMFDRKQLQDPLAVVKDIRGGRITREVLNETTVGYTYLYFFFKSVMPKKLSDVIKDRKDLRKSIKYLSLCNNRLPLRLKRIFETVLFEQATEKKPMGALAVCKEIINYFNDSFLASKDYQPMAVETAAYAQLGLKKSRMEDQFYTLQVGNSALLMAADGISTADIGNGRRASAVILNHLEDKEEELKTSLKELEQSVTSYQAWQEKAHNFLNREFERINHRIVELLNKLLLVEYDESQHIMSSTLNLAVITGNWVSIAWLGDSPGFIFKGEELTSLLTPHIEESRDLRAVIEGQKETFDHSSGEKITRRLPELYYEQSKREFIKNEALKQKIDYKDLFLKSDEILLLGSDGIVDCLSGGEEKLEELIKNDSSSTLKELAYNLTKAAAEDKSFDNITLTVAKLKERGDK